jgi:hypothetical protein
MSIYFSYIWDGGRSKRLLRLLGIDDTDYSVLMIQPGRHGSAGAAAAGVEELLYLLLE